MKTGKLVLTLFLLLSPAWMIIAQDLSPKEIIRKADDKFNGEKTTVSIGDHTTIREFVTINRGTSDRWVTKVGSHCLIMAYSHIAHDCIIGNHCILSNSVQVAGHVTLGDYAWIAGVSAVHQFVHIGQHAYIAGGSLVSKDVPPYIKAVRNPLSYGGVNSVGLKRRGFDLEKINHILDIYRYIFNKGMNTTQALEFIEEEIQFSNALEMILSDDNYKTQLILNKKTLLEKFEMKKIAEEYLQ